VAGPNLPKTDIVRTVRTRHLNSERCLDLILGCKTFDESEGSVDTGFGNPTARKLSGSLQLMQRGVDKITGASPESFLQPTPPNFSLPIGRVKLGISRSHPAASPADRRPTQQRSSNARRFSIPVHFILAGFANERTSDRSPFLFLHSLNRPVPCFVISILLPAGRSGA
jgi:hypothetical protein